MPQGLPSESIMPSPARVVILGSTGSVGRSAVEVLRHDGGTRLRAFGLAARANVDRLVAQAKLLRPRFIVLDDGAAAASLDGALRGTGIEALFGPEGIERLVRAPEVDSVLTAVVGAAGL